MRPEPDDPWQRAMRQGAFVRAWQISDRILRERLARAEPQHLLPRHLQAVWNGRSLSGKHVLVRCYHGLGDTIQFIRFAWRLRTVAREVSVWAQPDLLPLVATAAGVDRVLPLHDGAPDLAYDADIEIMELAHAFRITPADLPGPVPYLHPTSRTPRHADGPTLTVGLVWSGGDWDPRRSMHLSALRPLLTLPGIRVVSLQRGPAAAQCHRADIADASSDDVALLAARLCEFDLLISIDTFAAHLAGALGVPVWLMLHSACDWRWMKQGDRSPWYPTMRLFRQRRAGDWSTVVADIMQALTNRSAPAAKIRNKAIGVTFAR